MVVDEAGGRVNIFGENVFLLDACLLLIGYTCTYDTLKINESFIFYTAVWFFFKYLKKQTLIE